LKETFLPTSLTLEEGVTSPPDMLSEKELISLMDKNGIGNIFFSEFSENFLGTDATIAQHIETILDRGYATKVNGLFFAPTTLGVALVDAYISMGLELSKPRLRAEVSRFICNSW
jgi:DNA topoisomerase-3